MPPIDVLKKQAKQLVRWHRDHDYSVGERLRAALPRYRELSDIEILALKFPLAEAQEVIAREAGFPDWAALKSADGAQPAHGRRRKAAPAFHRVETTLFVSDVTRTARWFETVLGFKCDFLHGAPPFFGQVVRGEAALYLRYVRGPVFAGDIREREHLLAVNIRVGGVTALFAEFKAAGADFFQTVKRHPWGDKDFVVRDPDGNLLSFCSGDEGE